MLAAMDGGAFVASPSVQNIGKARRISTGPRAARQTPSDYPPLPPYYNLIVVYAEPRPLAASSGGLVTPYNHRVTPHGSLLRREYYVPSADCRVYRQKIGVVLFYSPS